jgi:TonB family protein
LQAQSDAPPDARSLLMRSGDSVLMADTVRLEGTEITDISFPGNHNTITGTFVLDRAGERMRLEFSVANSKSLVLNDGENVWVYNAASHTYFHAEQAHPPMADPFGRLKYSRDPEAFHDAGILREESLPFGAVQVPCYVVHAAYDSVPGNLTARNANRTVWISKTDSRILRDLWDFTVKSGDNTVKNEISDTYTVIDSGMPTAPGTFIFTPPAGSREMTLGAPANATQNPPVAMPKIAAARAVLEHGAQPEYTPEARAAGLQGTVSLYVVLGSDGRPSSVDVIQGLGLGLDEKAIEAVRKYQYNTADREIGEVDVPFRLDPPAPWDVPGDVFSAIVPPGQKVKHREDPILTRYVVPEAAACQTTGDVELRFRIGTDGSPRDVLVARGNTGTVGDAAVKAVEGWHFTPATINGKLAEGHGEAELECRHEGMILESEKSKRPDYRVGGGISPPVLIYKAEPEYAEEARKAKLQGTVMLYVQISPGGKPTAMKVVKSLGLGLNQKALQAVKRWRFRPGMKAGQPVTVEATIEVNFKLL